MQLAPITNHLLPNLSEILPKMRIAIALQVDQMMENKEELSLGPMDCQHLHGHATTKKHDRPMSSLMLVKMAAGGENPQ
jgi:hypothetical protein